MLPISGTITYEIKRSQTCTGNRCRPKSWKTNQCILVKLFGKPTGFVTGPEKSARLNDCSIVFAHFYKTKRGHYRMDTEFVADSIKDWKEGDLTKIYVSYVEKCIRKEPANYLWSHRRWKHEYKPEYGELLDRK
ncbi:MAG: hypothetical protein IPP79_03035 [Chitinophagaceae bacterium]|nr:hypothetical protein [Chitinophagaceae bacterium]